MDSQTIDIENNIAADPFEIRLANFGTSITFHAPGLKRYSIEGFEQKNPNAFLPISITGGGCALACDHCDAKILEPMLPLNPREGLYAMCERLASKGDLR